MCDACKTVTLDGVSIQENGIIRNSKGRIIARLVEEVNFESEHVQGCKRKEIPTEEPDGY